MSEGNSEMVAQPDKEKSDIQQVLQEVPDDLLIGVIADRIQREPSEEVSKGSSDGIAAIFFRPNTPSSNAR